MESIDYDTLYPFLVNIKRSLIDIYSIGIFDEEPFRKVSDIIDNVLYEFFHRSENFENYANSFLLMEVFVIEQFWDKNLKQKEAEINNFPDRFDAYMKQNVEFDKLTSIYLRQYNQNMNSLREDISSLKIGGNNSDISDRIFSMIKRIFPNLINIKSFGEIRTEICFVQSMLLFKKSLSYLVSLRALLPAPIEKEEFQHIVEENIPQKNDDPFAAMPIQEISVLRAQIHNLENENQKLLSQINNHKISIQQRDTCINEYLRTIEETRRKNISNSDTIRELSNQIAQYESMLEESKTKMENLENRFFLDTLKELDMRVTGVKFS